MQDPETHQVSRKKKEVWSFAIVKLEQLGISMDDGPGWAAEVFIKNPDGTYDETQYLEPGKNWDPMTETTWEPMGPPLADNPQAMYEDLLKMGGIHDSTFEAPDPEVYLEVFSPEVKKPPPKKITTEDCKAEIVKLLQESNLDVLWENIDDPRVHETRESWVKACLECLRDGSLNEQLETEEDVRRLVLDPKNWIRQRKYNDPSWGIVREFILRDYEDIEAEVHEKGGVITRCSIERD